MSRLHLILYALVLTVAAWLIGSNRAYDKGHAAGKLEVQAARDSQAVQQLGGMLSAHGDLVKNANLASSKLRLATATRSRDEQQFLKGFEDAIKKTAPDRAGCVFDAGLMQQLDTAHKRATDAATGISGSHVGAVPSTTSNAGGKR